MAVLSMAQDRAGYIWAGTEGGLFRYDGTRFRLMGQAEGLPCGTEIHTLYLASDGGLWTHACNQILRFDGESFHSVLVLRGPLGGAQRIAEDANGKVVVSTEAGLKQVLPSGVKPYPVPHDLEGKQTRGILRHGSQLWFGCDLHLCVEDGGRTSTYGPENGLPEDSWDGIAVAPDETVWVRSSNHLYRKPPSKDHFIQEKPDLGSSMFWGAITITADGSVMIPTDQGLAIRGASGWIVVDRQRGLRRAMTSAVIEDRGGSVWIGLVGGGIARWLGRGEWESWTVEQGLPSDVIWSIRRGHNGALWVGASLGLARIDSARHITIWTAKNGLGSDTVRWLGETSDGFIWAGSRPGGLARIDPATGKIHLISTPDLGCDSVSSLLVDRLDRIWVGSPCGILLNSRPAVSDRFVRIDQPDSLKRKAWSAAMDLSGAMWVTNPEGLWRLGDGAWRHYGKPDGLLSSDAYVLAVAPDGALWLRHRLDAGVERVQLSGDRIVRVDMIVPGNPQSNDLTSFHGFDAFGNFWRGSANGVAVLRGNSWRQMTTEDGLIWNDCDGEAFWGDADGSAWIGTSAGLAHYRPPSAAPPPPVADPIITSLKVTQRPRVVRAEFSSLNFKYEQLVHFAYRLDNGSWTDTAERAVSFAGLGPGPHRLEIRSHIRDAAVSSTIAATEFQMDPYWFETWWLRCLYLLAVASSAWGILRWRHRLLEGRNRELESAVRERTAELETERKRADEASEAKGRFLANMSHELRTPLNGVIGLSRLLEAMTVPPEAQEMVRMIRSSGDALLRVVNDVLDFSKVEAGKLELEVAPFPLHQSLEESVGLFQLVAADKGLRLACVLAPGLPAYVAGDDTRLRQVVLNLISNALKFTSAGEVVLSASAEPLDDSSYAITIEVRDSGIGIRPDQLPRLFSSFDQTDASINRRFGGTGLGLAISKRLVELMGGEIVVESQPGEGATFGFTIRMGRVDDPAAARARPAAPALDAENFLKVLVAEDNVVNQKVVLMLLKKLGVNADLAVDGRQAIAAVVENRYDLVLMDVQMPDVDGLSATREIRSRVPQNRQPVIFGLSAHATTEFRETCLAAGMDGYLTKPLEQEKLRDLIATLSAKASPRVPSLNRHAVSMRTLLG
jgi:signal transduction histidine kinase/CheY-like chemotaxis protein/ligand-binding sensor domain-containing protein